MTINLAALQMTEDLLEGTYVSYTLIERTTNQYGSFTQREHHNVCNVEGLRALLEREDTDMTTWHLVIPNTCDQSYGYEADACEIASYREFLDIQGVEDIYYWMSSWAGVGLTDVPDDMTGEDWEYLGDMISGHLDYPVGADSTYRYDVEQEWLDQWIEDDMAIDVARALGAEHRDIWEDLAPDDQQERFFAALEAEGDYPMFEHRYPQFYGWRDIVAKLEEGLLREIASVPAALGTVAREEYVISYVDKLAGLEVDVLTRALQSQPSSEVYDFAVDTLEAKGYRVDWDHEGTTIYEVIKA